MNGMQSRHLTFYSIFSERELHVRFYVIVRPPVCLSVVCSLSSVKL